MNCVLSPENLFLYFNSYVSQPIHFDYIFQTIEHLHTNTLLEHLDLSENSISHISNLSLLTKLKVSS